MFASISYNIDSVILLLNSGVDFELRSIKNMTAFDYVKERPTADYNLVKRNRIVKFLDDIMQPSASYVFEKSKTPPARSGGTKFLEFLNGSE